MPILNWLEEAVYPQCLCLNMERVRGGGACPTTTTGNEAHSRAALAPWCANPHPGPTNHILLHRQIQIYIGDSCHSHLFFDPFPDQAARHPLLLFEDLLSALLTLLVPCLAVLLASQWLIFIHLSMLCTFLMFSGKAIVEPSRNSHYWKPTPCAKRAGSCSREDERQR